MSKPDLLLEESDVLKIQNNEELIDLINRLTNSTQDELFNDYKRKTEQQLKQSEQLVQEMNEELDRRQKIIDDLQRKSATKPTAGTPVKDNRDKTEDIRYMSPIRRKTDPKLGIDNRISKGELAKELENIGITLDMLELLTGLRIINYEEDENLFHFDIRQSSTRGTGDEITILYKLIIAKDFSDSAEINYVPTFLDALDESEDSMEVDEFKTRENAELLIKILPDYFCDKLTFPYNTLSQFYTKMNRSLTKRKN